MKNIIITIILLFAFLAKTSAQNITLVENITWEFTDTKMTIYFDLLSPDNKDRTYDLDVKINLGDQIIEPTKGITGKIGQRNGKGRKVIWYYVRSGKEQRELDIPELDVIIVPKNLNPPLATSNSSGSSSSPSTSAPIVVRKQKLPSLTLPAVVTGVGAGVAIYGLILEGDASSLYDEYKANTVDSPTRDQQYEDADSKHITAQYLTYGGGLVAATGIYLISRTMKKRKAIKNKNLSIIPATGDSQYLGSNVGIGIQFRF